MVVGASVVVVVVDVEGAVVVVTGAAELARVESPLRSAAIAPATSTIPTSAASAATRRLRRLTS